MTTFANKKLSLAAFRAEIERNQQYQDAVKERYFDRVVHLYLYIILELLLFLYMVSYSIIQLTNTN